MKNALLHYFFKRHILSSLRKNWAGVWLCGALPEGKAIIVANHNSWWDGYLMAALQWHHGHTNHVIMLDSRLRQFPFLTSVGAISHLQVRTAARVLAINEQLVVFPEGALRPVGAVQHIQPGVAWFHERSGAAIIPVAVRLLVRGQEKPEAYIAVGQSCPVDGIPEAINALLHSIDQANSSQHPEQPLPYFTLMLKGTQSQSERSAKAAKMLSLISGFK